MRRVRRQTAFTLMEMLFALVTMGVIGTAVAAMVMAAGNAWDTRDDYRRQVTDARAVMTHVTEWVRGARRIVAVHQTGTSNRYTHLVLWHNDDHFVGEVNLSEMRVITCDAQQGTLVLYAANLTEAQKQSAGTNPSWEPATVSTAAWVASFAERADVGAYPMAEHLSDFTATLGEPGEGEPLYRLVELRLVLAGPGGAGDQMELTTAYVRAPDTSLDFEN